MIGRSWASWLKVETSWHEPDPCSVEITEVSIVHLVAWSQSGCTFAACQLPTKPLWFLGKAQLPNFSVVCRQLVRSRSQRWRVMALGTEDLAQGIEKGSKVRVKEEVTIYHSPKLGESFNLQGREGTVLDVRSPPLLTLANSDSLVSVMFSLGAVYQRRPP